MNTNNLSHVNQQKEFLLAMGKRVDQLSSEFLSYADLELCVKLIDEEVNRELIPAVNRVIREKDCQLMDLTQILDGIVDSVYVIYQLCNTLGLPFDEAWDEIHASNMAKRGEDGKVKYREDGKVLKPDGWKPPNVEKIVMDHLGYSTHSSQSGADQQN